MIKKHYKTFQTMVDWSANHYSQLPWRQNRDLYSTLVSEIMLQQTTVSTVTRYYPPFMSKFPTLAALAKASEDDIRSAWRGLGYYRRAQNLHKACIKIQNDFAGKIPTIATDLLGIPGIGPYTANAILSLGADKPALAMDVNLERVLARYFLIENPKKETSYQKIVFSLFDVELKEYTPLSSRAVNEALMDVGRSICLKKQPSCVELTCPLKATCKAYALQKKSPQIDVMANYPKIVKQNEEKIELLLARLWIQKGKKIAVVKKKMGYWLQGQYELPTLIVPNTLREGSLKQYKIWKNKIALPTPLAKLNSSITKYKITNYIIPKKFANLFENEEMEFVNMDDPLLSTLTLKIVKILFNHESL